MWWRKKPRPYNTSGSSGGFSPAEIHAMKVSEFNMLASPWETAPRFSYFAGVTSKGGLSIGRVHGELSAKDALALAAWILDTFGPTPTAIGQEKEG